MGTHANGSSAGSQKGVADPFTLIVLLAGLFLGLYLVGQRTNLFPRAQAPSESLPVSISTPSSVPGYYRVFVTSTAYDGNLGGLAGADAKCQERANAANLGGNWKAWVSSDAASAASRLKHSDIPYRLSKGGLVANDWSDLVDGELQTSIVETEFGTAFNTAVWTGTRFDGAVTRNATCENWTTSASSAYGSQGQSWVLDIWWAGSNDPNTWAFCSASRSLYCFEQEESVPTPTPTPVKGCTFDDLRAAFASRRGDPKFNPACDFNNDSRISVIDYSTLLWRK